MLICTALNATPSAPSATASASRSTGTVRTSKSLTSRGNNVDVNSTSGTTTRARSGSPVAAVATSCDTVAPTATRSTGTPTRRANTSRAASVTSPHASQLVRPPRQSASASCIASNAGRGGSP